MESGSKTTAGPRKVNPDPPTSREVPAVPSPASRARGTGRTRSVEPARWTDHPAGRLTPKPLPMQITAQPPKLAHPLRRSDVHHAASGCRAGGRRCRLLFVWGSTTERAEGADGGPSAPDNGLSQTKCPMMFAVSPG